MQNVEAILLHGHVTRKIDRNILKGDRWPDGVISEKVTIGNHCCTNEALIDRRIRVGRYEPQDLSAKRRRLARSSLDQEVVAMARGEDDSGICGLWVPFLAMFLPSRKYCELNRK